MDAMSVGANKKSHLNYFGNTNAAGAENVPSFNSNATDIDILR
jgi:hypothetical protein